MLDKLKYIFVILILSNFGFQTNLYSRTLEKSKNLSLLRESKAMGEGFLKEGNYHKAIEQFEIALKLSRELREYLEEANILIILGLINWNLGRMEVSSFYYKSARELAQAQDIFSIKRESEIALEIYQLYIKGKNSRISGQYEKSIKFYEEAIFLARIIFSPNHEIKCLRQMSLNYWEMNKIDQYFRLCEIGQKLANNINNYREEGIFLNNIGLYYWKINEFSRSLKYFQLSLEIAEKERQLDNISNCLTNISLVYSALGDYDKALSYLDRGILIDQELRNDFNVSTDLNNIGNVYLNKGNLSGDNKYYCLAIERFLNSLIIAQRIQDKKVESIIQNNIGEAYYAQNKYDQALDNYFKALINADAIGFLELVSMLNNNIANTYTRKGLFNKAISFYKKSIDIAVENKYEKILWESFYGLGQCYENNEEYSKAIEFYNKSINAIEKTRSQIYLETFKAGYVRNKSKVYESLIYLIWKTKERGKSGSLEENMFYFIEKVKARAFVEILVESKINIANKMNPIHIKELEAASKRISSIYFELMKNNLSIKSREKYEEQLSQEEDIYLRIIAKIKERDPALTGLLSIEPCILVDLQKKGLDNQTVFIEYYLGEQKSFLLFIAKKSFRIYELPPRQKIEKSIKAYIKYLSSPLYNPFYGNIAAKRIFKELLFPLENLYMSGINKITINPDGILYYLPFESLIVTNANNISEYLIERYQISYIPSASALMLLQEKDKEIDTFRGLLAFGDPILHFDMNPLASKTIQDYAFMENNGKQGYTFSSIPSSRKEINVISKYFSKYQRFIYIGKEATEEALKVRSHNNYQIIHFACHSFLDELHPIRSALVLSQDREKSNDGILQVRELYNMKLKANIVILSACQTGKGALEKGEGILGLNRVFFYSGARSVLSTLWSVDDESPSYFMDVYYKYLFEGYSNTQALRLAKINMINSNFSHPFYWASFVLSGESKIIIKFY